MNSNRPSPGFPSPPATAAGSRLGRVRWLAGLVTLALAALAAEEHDQAARPVPVIREGRHGRMSAPELEAVGNYTAALFRGEPTTVGSLPPAFRLDRWVVYLAARIDGDRVAHAWGGEAPGAEAVISAVGLLGPGLSPSQRRAVTTLEIDLAHSFERVNPARETARLSNVHRGLVGIELGYQGRAFRFGPTEMIALNLDFDRALERLAGPAGLGTLVPGGELAPVRVFQAQQLLVELGPLGARTVPLYRGNTVVPVEAITRPAVATLSSNLAQWLTSNLRPDGRMVYLYWPSRGQESTANNELRQWMATVALTRLARSRGDTGLMARVEQNLRHNLARGYRIDADGHGQIVEDGTTVKLGAVAMACLALIEHPRRAAFAAEEAALLRTVSALWQTNGEFRTFWLPQARRDNVNFYPGEALLVWATLYAESKDPALLERIMTSMRFYRSWHRANRNPAFVPWHTQAYFKVWEQTRSAELRDWVFEMNDWLLGIQQWDSQRDFPDTMGRFYDPDRPFGPPHASSDGVYLEGLIDAWRLARETGDVIRQGRYRQALIRGLRNVTQLTFRDETDLFYVSRRERVFGGVRTTVYDNSIRVDNVQHNLMAMLKILEHLPAEDFRP